MLLFEVVGWRTDFWCLIVDDGFRGECPRRMVEGVLFGGTWAAVRHSGKYDVEPAGKLG